MNKILLILAICIQMQCVNSIKKPIIEIKATHQNIGAIKFGKTHIINFTLYNKGNANLVIDTATSSCGCTEPKLEKKVLKPLDSSHLSVYFNPVDTGNFKKTIVIKSNIDSVFTVITFRGNTY